MVRHSGKLPGWQRFEFGVQKPAVNHIGEPITLADYALHVACAWRIVGPKGIAVGSFDYYFDGESPLEQRHDFWDGPGQTLRDRRGYEFFDLLHKEVLVVSEVGVDSVGSLHVAMAEGYVLDVLPVDSTYEEHWRLLPPGKNVPHFVLSGEGGEWAPEEPE